MLYRRIVARLTLLNGDRFDTAVIDTSLEYSEALNDIARRHPEIRTCKGGDGVTSLIFRCFSCKWPVVVKPYGHGVLAFEPNGVKRHKCDPVDAYSKRFEDCATALPRRFPLR